LIIIKKYKCPDCNCEISFITKFKMDPRFPQRCNVCGTKIGEPIFVNIPLIIIFVVLLITFDKWISDHLVICIFILALLILMNRLILAICAPIVKK